MLAFDGKAEAAQFCFEKAAVRWAWKETSEIEASEKLAYARDARTGLFPASRVLHARAPDHLSFAEIKHYLQPIWEG